MLVIPDHVRIGKTPDVLFQIREIGVNLAIWEREIPLPLADEINAISLQESFRELCRRITAINAPIPVLSLSKQDNAKSEIQYRLNFLYKNLNFLAKDHADLLDLYKTIFPKATEFSYETRAESGPRSKSATFHIDNYFDDFPVCRLVTSYLEDGPEWLAEGPHPIVEQGFAIPCNDSYRQKTNRGAVCLIKGGCEGVYHASPEIPDNSNRIVTLIGSVFIL